jgi:hypothetical protein
MKLSELLDHMPNFKNRSISLGWRFSIEPSDEFEFEEYVADFVFFDCPLCDENPLQIGFWIDGSVTDCKERCIPPNTLVLCKRCAKKQLTPEEYAKLNGLPMWEDSKNGRAPA